MKNSKHVFYLIGAALMLFSIQSCKKENSSDDSPREEPLTYPHTVYYSHNINTEFRMWTDGHEVNTSALSAAQYSHGLYSQGEPTEFELAAGYIFTEDSLTQPGSIFGPIERPYMVRNDSIFFVADVEVSPGVFETWYPFFTFGSQRQMRFTKGAFYLINDQTESYGFSLVKNSYYTREQVGHINSYDVELEDFSAGDTLIIFNSTLVFN